MSENREIQSKSGSRAISRSSSASSMSSNMSDNVDQKVSKKSSISGTGRSAKAGVFLPIGRIHTFLKKGGYAKRISQGASVYLCGALDYVMQTIIAHGISNLRMNRRKRLQPQDIRVVFDRIVPFDELGARTLKPVFRGGGARVQIHPNLKMSMRTKRKPGKLLPAVIYDKVDDDKFDYGRYQIPDAQYADKLNELKKRRVIKRSGVQRVSRGKNVMSKAKMMTLPKRKI